jgi:hypothetical protein
MERRMSQRLVEEVLRWCWQRIGSEAKFMAIHTG